MTQCSGDQEFIFYFSGYCYIKIIDDLEEILENIITQFLNKNEISSELHSEEAELERSNNISHRITNNLSQIPQFRFTYGPLKTNIVVSYIDEYHSKTKHMISKNNSKWSIRMYDLGIVANGLCLIVSNLSPTKLARNVDYNLKTLNLKYFPKRTKYDEFFNPDQRRRLSLTHPSSPLPVNALINIESEKARFTDEDISDQSSVISPSESQPPINSVPDVITEPEIDKVSNLSFSSLFKKPKKDSNTKNKLDDNQIHLLQSYCQAFNKKFPESIKDQVIMYKKLEKKLYQ